MRILRRPDPSLFQQGSAVAILQLITGVRERSGPNGDAGGGFSGWKAAGAAGLTPIRSSSMKRLTWELVAGRASYGASVRRWARRPPSNKFKITPRTQARKLPGIQVECLELLVIEFLAHGVGFVKVLVKNP